MRKFLPVFILFFFLSKPVLADYQKAYSDYTYNYSQYRAAVNDYQVSKSSYLTYRTLNSQADATNKLRQVLISRDQVMIVYYDLLYEKLAATPGVENDAKTTFFGIRQSEKTWLSEHQKRLNAAGSFEDLNAASVEFENRFPQMDFETKQGIGNVILAKEKTLSNQWQTLADKLSLKRTEAGILGEDTVAAQRGMISAKNKQQLFTDKLGEINRIFSPAGGNQKIELFPAQQKFLESNQYLREANNFLIEIVKIFTG